MNAKIKFSADLFYTGKTPETVFAAELSDVYGINFMPLSVGGENPGPSIRWIIPN